MLFPGGREGHLTMTRNDLVETCRFIPKLLIHSLLQHFSLGLVELGILGFTEHLRHLGESCSISIHVAVDSSPITCHISAEST